MARETDSAVTIGLEVPGWPGHRAGQHLDVRLTAEDGYQAERSYSIASSDGEPVAITVERLGDGEVSPYLTDEGLMCPQRKRQAFMPDPAPCANSLRLRLLRHGLAGR